jgi:16S rRNA processing protein RimM
VPLPDNLVVMGRVAVPFGVHGWVKIQPFTEKIDGLSDFSSWWLGDGESWREYVVLESAAHNATLHAKLDGCVGRDAAVALKGKLVAVPREALPAAGNNEYYWSDLVGLAVVNLQGEALGKVTGLLETGANDVLVVMGEQERLIPFIGQYVVEVDMAGGQVRVDWGTDY